MYRICHLEKPHSYPIKVGRNGRHTIPGPGILTIRSLLHEKDCVVGKEKNGWTVVAVSKDKTNGEFYSPSKIGVWPVG